MKKVVFLFAFVAMVLSISAQPRAIGARLGYGVDLSYQHSLGKNMVEANLGTFIFSGVKLDATYNWVFPISGGWNWYVGVGAGLNTYWKDDANSFTLGAVAKIGVEYNFNVPFQISLDFAPTLGPTFTGNSMDWSNDNLIGGLALGLRYRF